MLSVGLCAVSCRSVAHLCGWSCASCDFKRKSNEIIYLAQRSCSALRMPLAPHLNCMRQMQTNRQTDHNTICVISIWRKSIYIPTAHSAFAQHFKRSRLAAWKYYIFTRRTKMKKNPPFRSHYQLNCPKPNSDRLVFGCGNVCWGTEASTANMPVSRWACLASDVQVEVQKTIIPCLQGNSWIMTYSLAIFVSERYAWVRHHSHQVRRKQIHKWIAAFNG